MSGKRKLISGVWTVVVTLVMGCAGGLKSNDQGSTENSVAMAEEAIDKAEGMAKGLHVSDCISQCTQKLRTELGSGKPIHETIRLINEMLACVDTCLSNMLPPVVNPTPQPQPNPIPPINDAQPGQPGTSQPGQPGGCSTSTTINGVEYEVQCQGGTCSCSKNGLQVMTCQSGLDAVCSISADAAGVVHAGCCNFVNAVPPVNPQPQPQPQPDPIPPIDNGQPGQPGTSQPGQPGGCSTSSSINGVDYEVQCQGGTCRCSKNGLQVMTCQSGLDAVCSISVDAAGVLQAGCCQF